MDVIKIKGDCVIWERAYRDPVYREEMMKRRRELSRAILIKKRVGKKKETEE